MKKLIAEQQVAFDNLTNEEIKYPPYKNLK